MPARSIHHPRRARRRAQLLGLAAVVVTTAAASADDVRLRASVRLPRDVTTVRLGDVAALDGAHATALADVVLSERDPELLLELHVDDVRAAIDAHGVHWGHVNLSGRTIIVRPHPNRGAAAPAPMQTLAVPGARRSVVEVPRVVHTNAVDIINDATAGGAIVRAMVLALEVEPEVLRLHFDAKHEASMQRSDDGCRIEVEAVSSFKGDRLILVARAWRGGQVEWRERVVIQPLLETTVAELSRDVRRNTTLTAADVTLATRWLPPSERALAARHDALAEAVVTQTLPAGTVLRTGALRQPTLVRRGDVVTVRCLVGGMVISMIAHAREDGAEGEQIEVRRPKERDTFLATVSRRGEVVVDLAQRKQAASAPATAFFTGSTDQ